jgi:hypothetical protein
VVLFVLVLVPLLCLAGDFPAKCNSGNIVQRDALRSTGWSAPVSSRHPRFDQSRYKVEIDGGRYREQFMSCNAYGDCEWIDTDWRRLSESSHGMIHNPAGYEAFRGTLPDGEGLYVCWFPWRGGPFPVASHNSSRSRRKEKHRPVRQEDNIREDDNNDLCCHATVENGQEYTRPVSSIFGTECSDWARGIGAEKAWIALDRCS